MGATLNLVVAAVPLAVEMMAGLVGHLSLAQAAVVVELVMTRESILAQEVPLELGVVIRQGMAYQAEAQVVVLVIMERAVVMDVAMAAQAVALMRMLPMVGQEAQAERQVAEVVVVDVVMMPQEGKVEQAEMAQLESIVGR